MLEAEAVEADSPMLVAGELRQGSTGLSDPVINPSTGAVFAHVPHGTVDDLNEAVASAKAAYETWSKTSYEERAACLRKYGELLAANADKLAEALSKEQGKPLAMAKMEVMGTAADCELVATEGDLEPEVTKEDDDARWELQYIPRGVIGGIAPWNFPISTAGNKIHPAVITGNTIVLKPSPYTPLATAMMSEMAAEAFPAGVVNIVTGSDDLGQMIVEHPDIAHITFTGSARTGQKIMATAAMHGLKKVTLELGGNDAAVVLPDVNPAEVAPQLFQGAMFNTGQVCCAIKRVFGAHNTTTAHVLGMLCSPSSSSSSCAWSPSPSPSPAPAPAPPCGCGSSCASACLLSGGVLCCVASPRVSVRRDGRGARQAGRRRQGGDG